MLIILVTSNCGGEGKELLKTCFIFVCLFLNHCCAAEYIQGSKTAWMITPMEAIQRLMK